MKKPSGKEGLLCASLVPVALWLGDNAVERALLIGSLLLVMMVELLNSAIEAAIDRIGPERHELVGPRQRASVQPQYLSPYLMPRWYG